MALRDCFGCPNPERQPLSEKKCWRCQNVLPLCLDCTDSNFCVSCANAGFYSQAAAAVEHTPTQAECAEYGMCNHCYHFFLEETLRAGYGGRRFCPACA